MAFRPENFSSASRAGNRNNSSTQRQHQQQHKRTPSEVTKEMLKTAERRSALFQRPPFDPSAVISHYEVRVTPNRNYGGSWEENPASYFAFPAPDWVQQQQQQQLSRQQAQLPAGIVSALAACQSRMPATAFANDENVPQAFPQLTGVVEAKGPGQPWDDMSGNSGSPRKRDGQGAFALERLPGNNKQAAGDEERPTNNSSSNSNKRSNSASQNVVDASAHVKTVTSLSQLAVAVLVDCEGHERRVIESDHEDSFMASFVVRAQELMKADSEERLRRARSVSAANSSSPARRQMDRALQRFVAMRIDAIGDQALALASAVFEEFDPAGNGLFAPVRRDGSINSDSDADGASAAAAAAQKERKAGSKDKSAELVDAESRVAELEAQLKWSKFERKRLDDILRAEAADAAAARAARDATMQQLAALEAECVPLILGMQEIFYGAAAGANACATGTPAAHAQQQQQGIITSPLHSILGAAGLVPTTTTTTTTTTTIGERQRAMKRALERVAEQLESPLLSRRSGALPVAPGGDDASPSRRGTADHFDADGDKNDDERDAAVREQLQRLDQNTLASMLLLERQLAQRMLIGASSQIVAEVENQKRFVDVHLMQKKQAAHSLFLADLFQHRLPQLRRATSALASVLHKYDACSTPNVPRHKSNVISRHNPGCVPASRSGSVNNNNNNNNHPPQQLSHPPQPSSVTHSALVAYSKSLVAHVAALLRWLDTEVTN